MNRGYTIGVLLHYGRLSPLFLVRRQSILYPALKSNVAFSTAKLRPDLIVTDLAMPVLNGLEAA